ncbi:hypothetical protein JCM11641_005324 [Rhodosporidiobolus odoratus]
MSLVAHPSGTPLASPTSSTRAASLLPRPASSTPSWPSSPSPLLIGISAGFAALFGESKMDRQRRDKAGWFKKVVVWLGFVGCIAAVWPVLFYVIREQTSTIKQYVAVFTAFVEAGLVKAGSERLSADEDEEDDVEADYLHPSAEDEKKLLTAREFFLDSRSSESVPVLVNYLRQPEKTLEVRREEQGERLLIHSFAV